MKQPGNSRITLALAVLAGLIYSSWPIGYIVNPKVAAHGLASELAGAHQPYAWIFVYGDVAVGLLMLLIAARLWQQLKPSRQQKGLVFIILNVGGFGLATIIDALLPLSCSMSTQICPDALHDPLLLTHALFTVIASNCLLVVSALLWNRTRTSRYLLALLVGYLLTSLVTVIYIAFNNEDNLPQHLLLSVCSLLLISYPYAITKTAEITAQKSRRPKARMAKSHQDV
jgi:hypothetical protein